MDEKVLLDTYANTRVILSKLEFISNQLKEHDERINSIEGDLLQQRHQLQKISDIVIPFVNQTWKQKFTLYVLLAAPIIIVVVLINLTIIDDRAIAFKPLRLLSHELYGPYIDAKTGGDLIDPYNYSFNESQIKGN